MSEKKKAPRMDDYDRLMEAGERSRRENSERRKKRAKKKKKGSLYTTFILILLLIACAGVLMLRVYQFKEFKTLRAGVDISRYFTGLKVDGIDIGGMTPEEAKAQFDDYVEPRYRAISVTLDSGYTVTSEDMGYESDYANVLEKAFFDQRSGSVSDIRDRMKSYAKGGISYDVTRKLYNESAIDAFVDMAAGKIDSDPSDAHVTGFNADTYEMTFSDGESGRKLNTAKMKSDVISAFNGGGGTVTLEISEIAPTVTASEIKSQYGMIAMAKTNASSSSKNRLNNIKLALSIINGTAVAPGEVFSFNGTVGKRTEDRGFKMAGAYSDGTVTEQVGGGICQVSTTLFNCAVKSDMEITERHAHSLPVSYVDKGKDATVNWDSQDFKFKNTSDDTVYIAAALTDDKRVQIALFGKVLPNGEYIEVDAEVTETIDYETTYTPNPFLAVGVQNVIQEGRKGYKAVAYKIRYDKSGNRISKEVLCRSTYSKKDAVIEVGAE